MLPDGHLEALTIRPALPDDDARVVEIYNLQEPESVPQTIARYRMERAKHTGSHPSEHYIAIMDNFVVGYGSFHWAWWTGQPGIYALEIRIDLRSTRQGIGTKLYEVLRSRLVLRGATRFVAWVRSDANAGRRFAARLGCDETGQVIQEYRLDVAHADISAAVMLEARLEQKGIRLACLAELAGENVDFQRALQRLWADAGDKAPDEIQLRNSFETWRREVLQAPDLSPDTHWIALEGERPVGMTFLKRLSEDAYENDYTSVAANYRGQGIATALKLRAIAWAQSHGVQSFYTSSEIGNQPMVAVNTRLGYRPSVQRREVARKIP